MQTLEKQLEDTKKEVEYLKVLLKASLTGEMPNNPDFTTELYAIRTKGYLKYLEMSGEE
jgi:hypothetical protein